MNEFSGTVRKYSKMRAIFKEKDFAIDSLKGLRDAEEVKSRKGSIKGLKKG